MTTTREAALEAALKWMCEEYDAGGDGYEARKASDAALATPATEPQGYVEVPTPGRNLMEVALWTELHEAMIKDGHEPPRSLGANATAVIKQTVADYLEALAARPAPQPAAEPVGWVIANGADNRWRCVYEWESNSEWTDDKAKALKFATREDAERFSKEDEDAWLVYKVGLPQPAADTRVVTPQEAAQTLYDTMKTNRPLFDAMVEAAEDIELTGVSFNRVVGDALCAAIGWKEPAIIGTATPTQTYQSRVKPWLDACFGPEIAGDKTERNHRFLEEALELVQSGGCTASEAHQLVDYVYGRPVGEMGQEIGGVMNTLAALCLANGFDMHDAGEVELARVWTKVEKIRAKQAAKPKHSPLPEHTAIPAQPDKIAEAARDKTAAELVIDAYDAANPFRQADMHPALCHCNRCAIDWMRALAGKGE